MKLLKLEAEKAMDNNNDRISNLPKELLLYILSFLSTKDAVRTSILAKKWEYLWTSIDVLDFEERIAKRKCFTYFVERVLVLHHSLSLRKFALSFFFHADDAPHIYSWILAALRRNVKELHLSLTSIKDSFVFPHRFFTCTSITTLVLTMNWLSQVPKLIHFPNLKTMILKNVVFSDDNAVHQLFNGCPALETLSIYECIWSNLIAISISSSTLLRLEITDIQNSSKASGCQVMLFCENLKLFVYNGDLKNDYCLRNVPSLDTAWVNILNWSKRPRDIAYRLNKLLIELSIATSLTLSSSALKVQGYAEELFTHFPGFNNLTHFTLYPGYFELDHGLVNLLNKCPRLEHLTLAEGVRIQSQGERFDSLVTAAVLASLPSNLKTIIIGSFQGMEWEELAVKTLLKNASSLESLVIYGDTIFCKDTKKLTSFRKELSMISSRCKTAVLSFKEFRVSSPKFL